MRIRLLLECPKNKQMGNLHSLECLALFATLSVAKNRNC